MKKPKKEIDPTTGLVIIYLGGSLLAMVFALIYGLYFNN